MATKWRTKAMETLFLIFYYYALVYGICTFTYRKRSTIANYHQLFNKISGSKVISYTVIQCKCFTWCCAIFRIITALGYYYGDLMMWSTADQFYNVIAFLQSSTSVTGSICLGIGLLISGGRFVDMANSLICLFRRTGRLSPNKSIMGQHQFAFLLIIIICILNDAKGLKVLVEYTDWMEFALAFAKIYTDTGLIISLHITSIGYFSIGALYAFMNSYMKEEFQPRAKSLDYVLRRNYNYRSQHYRRKLIRMTRELNECLSIYNDIYRTANTFHNNVRIYIFFALLSGFSVITIIMYSLLYMQTVLGEFDWVGIVYCLKVVVMLLIMILSSYSAVQSDIGANKLSLDSVYMGGNTEWNRSVEIFINRMNLYEFKPNILGLFDISSDILLLFLSGSVTYLTYILQNTKLSQ